MSRIPLALLLIVWLPSTVAAQTRAPMHPGIEAERGANESEARSEAQPPEQSGQAQQMMKEAQVELERSALGIELAEAIEHDNAVLSAKEALEQFEESLGQLHQSVPGYVPLELATSLHEQVSQTLALLEGDTAAAASSMHELALRVTDLTAEADLLIGRTLLGDDHVVLGNISNVLITADGRIQALVVDRMAPGKNQQFLVEWGEVLIEGLNLVAKLGAAEVENLPSYVAE